MKSQHLAISFVEFEQMPKPFGWKAEYYNDKAHLTPRQNAIKTKLNLSVTDFTHLLLIQPVDINYQSQMIKAFYKAFRDSAEFCDWTAQEVKKHAEKNITDYFAGKPGN
jgi:hypothetical protein